MTLHFVLPCDLADGQVSAPVLIHGVTWNAAAAPPDSMNMGSLVEQLEEPSMRYHGRVVDDFEEQDMLFGSTPQVLICVPPSSRHRKASPDANCHTAASSLCLCADSGSSACLTWLAVVAGRRAKALSLSAGPLTATATCAAAASVQAPDRHIHARRQGRRRG